MSEYIRVKNDNNVTVIDDDYRNFHLINKIVRNTKVSDTLPPVDPRLMLYSDFMRCHTFTVQSVEKPLVAHNNAAVTQIRYIQVGTTWTITVFYSTQFQAFGYTYIDSYPFAEVVYYIFGLLPTIDANVSPRLIIRNAAGEIVFSNSHKPLQVVKSTTIIINFNTNGIVKTLDSIPNYDSTRTYAVCLCCPAHTINRIDAGGIFTFDQSCVLRKTVSYANNALTGAFQVVMNQNGSNGESANTPYSFTSPFHTHLIIDVTGY